MWPTAYPDWGSDTQHTGQCAPLLDLSAPRRGEEGTHGAAGGPGVTGHTAGQQPADILVGVLQQAQKLSGQTPPPGATQGTDHRGVHVSLQPHTTRGTLPPPPRLLPQTSFPCKEQLDPKTCVIALEQGEWSCCLPSIHRNA